MQGFTRTSATFAMTAATAILTASLSLQTQAREITGGTLVLTGGTNGGLSLTTTNIDAEGTQYDTNSLNLNAGARYFFQDNLAVGLRYSYEYNNREYEDGFEQESTLTTLYPGIYLNHSINDDNSLVFGGEFMLGSQEYQNTGEAPLQLDASGFAVRAEYTHFLNELLAVNAGAMYVFSSLEEDMTSIEAETSGLIMGLGLSVYLSR
ncbi:MAG: outer membrane beta-barrel protein [Pseudomonadota bacterium]|nr:outer membrane beta-barrel protein [Pseudomonadota bacterium]